MIISIDKPPAKTGDFPKIKKMQCLLSTTSLKIVLKILTSAI